MTPNTISRGDRFVMSKELRWHGHTLLFSMSDSRDSNPLSLLGGGNPDRTWSNRQNTYVSFRRLGDGKSHAGRSEVSTVPLDCIKLRGSIKLTVLGTVTPKRGRVEQSIDSDYFMVRRGVS